jgi:hypothetical protein
MSGSGLWLPSSIQAPRPNRKQRKAAAAGAAKQFGNMQRPHGLPPHLPPPEVKIGWNDENIVMVLCFGANEVPLPFTPEQNDLLCKSLAVAGMKVRELQKAAAAQEVTPGAAELLEQAQANVAAHAPAEDDLTFELDTNFGCPPVADAVTDSPE